MTTRPPLSPDRASQGGFTLVEMLIALGITTVMLGATMAALGDAVKLVESATLITGLNDNLRNGVDLMVGDLQQAGQGLPSGHVIEIPSGAGAVAMRLPGPPTTGYTYTGTSFCPPPLNLCQQVAAIIPGPGRGPEVVPGTATDMITILAADGTFVRASPSGGPVRLLVFTATSVTLEPAANLTDVLEPGQLLMLTKGSDSALVQITSASPSGPGVGQVITFAAGDSLRLNQSGAADGTPSRLRNFTLPPEVLTGGFLPTVATRIRMISYYLDATADPLHPRLARRINNGDAVTFNNLLGTVVAFDIENLSITYDVADGLTNRTGVRMTAADLQAGGACGAAPCSPSQIRKVNIFVSGRSRARTRGARQFFRNHLFTQVSLRSMAFGDRYRN